MSTAFRGSVGSPRTGRADWAREYQFNSLVAGMLPGQLAEAVTNLLQLYSMEAYQGSNGSDGWVWRVQYQKHAFRLNYCTVPGDWTSVAMWLQTCQEVEARYGHKP